MRGFFSQTPGPGLLSTTIISVIVFGHRFGCKHSKSTFFPSCSRPDIRAAGGSTTRFRSAAAARPRDPGVLCLTVVCVLCAASTFCCFSAFSWIGERVAADIRRPVFDRVIALSPAYFEVHRTGDILSRLTTDTTVLQTVIGSAVSQALRNALLLVGGLVMLAVTSIKLTLVVLLIVPVVVVPILFYGRRGRRLSRDRPDAIPALWAPP